MQDSTNGRDGINTIHVHGHDPDRYNPEHDQLIAALLDPASHNLLNAIYGHHEAFSGWQVQAIPMQTINAAEGQPRGLIDLDIRARRTIACAFCAALTNADSRSMCPNHSNRMQWADIGGVIDLGEDDELSQKKTKPEIEEEARVCPLCAAIRQGECPEHGDNIIAHTNSLPFVIRLAIDVRVTPTTATTILQEIRTLQQAEQARRGGNYDVAGIGFDDWAVVVWDDAPASVLSILNSAGLIVIKQDLSLDEDSDKPAWVVINKDLIDALHEVECRKQNS